MSEGLTMSLVEEALANDDYSKDGCDYTSTEINGPPQRTFLAQHHKAEFDPRRRYASFFGTAMHAHMEKLAMKREGAIVEERLKHTFDGIGQGEKRDIVFGGKPDVIYNRVLEDWKFTSPNNPSFWRGGKCKPEYVKQGKYNAWLAHKNGIEVDYVRVTHWLMGWSFDRAFEDPSYPQYSIISFAFEVTEPWEEIESDIRQKIILHEKAKLGDYPPCTDDEKWQSPSKWACRKPANKRARKLWDSQEEAQADVKDGEVIEERPSRPNRCWIKGTSSWCGYASNCSQHQRSFPDNKLANDPTDA